MLITHKEEDDVVIALHDNGLDIALTVDALLEGNQVIGFSSSFIYFIFFKYTSFNSTIFYLRIRGQQLVKRKKIEVVVSTKKKKRN